MSRYVDLDGLTWDGKPISSKIQEVKAKSGYMQGITVGWLWGDAVPHIDLAEHDKQIRDEVISDLRDLFWTRFHSEPIDMYFKELQLEGEQNE